MRTAAALEQPDFSPAVTPLQQETPVAFADRVGQAYAIDRTADHRKSHGLYLTPPSVAAFMAALIPSRDTLRLLDPAAGAGVLICAAVEELARKPNPPHHIEITAYEIDSELVEYLRMVLDHLTTWAKRRKIQVQATIHCEDFILAQAAALTVPATKRFDAVIANPPYLKINKNDPRAVAAADVVHGQPNIYGLFMAIAAALLYSGGEFVFITPRSFASGPYFRKFRERFFAMLRPLRTHVFASRSEAFDRDEVLQENVILHAVRNDDWADLQTDHEFVISTSNGLADLDQSQEWTIGLSEIINPNNLKSTFRLPATVEDNDILKRVDNWKGSLHTYGMEISTGPVVPFRATEFLTGKANGVTVPLLWMNHVQAMAVRWPLGSRKPEYIVNSPESKKLLVANSNYVLLRRFSAKEESRRLTAAPCLAKNLPGTIVGLENHLNYIYRPYGMLTEDEAWGIAALYSSALLDRYFRCINGNTQVSATELRAMPLPPLAAIVELGRRVKGESRPGRIIDELVEVLARPQATVKKKTKKRKAG